MQEFDLFARPAEAPRPLSVSELNERASRMLDEQLGRVLVEGEISGFVPHRSGHWYFTLKDARGQVSCACFKGSQRGIKEQPVDGAQVIVRGRLTVYSPRGSYQLVVDHLRPAGAGALLAKLEALKQKLLAEGLFAAERKRPLPEFVRRVGLVTSPDGAAVRDFLRVAGERHSGLKVLVLPTVVQGPTAAESIARTLRLASERAEVLGLDLLVLTRGGGSSEDLSAFNHELVARALADSAIPTVSAIGHEVDVTLADLVADVRAPTPTAAAQMVVQDMAAVHAALGQRLRELNRLMRLRVAAGQQRLQRAQLRLGDPARRMAHRRDRLRALTLRLERAHPQRLLAEHSARLKALNERLQNAMRATTARRHQRLGRVAATLDALSPLAVLQRGYAIALNQDRAVRRPADAPVGATLRIRLAQGALSVVVTSQEESNE